ncbi:Tetratricopeptide repeat-containing protein [Thiohalospira halophila DSM 15071]|uniref:Tetratricopeptide repeat-containing protein n=1 Tax=Thiohalospira halophila DSM 15071 TaxID=1123397 RepID=A0A1I1TSK4_9GAMM|nr:tetratricopeptide repeat protein [Thiohalospira halophila]SFD60208.1 Tetratricopeptide repeat-containing protein [Thiohalospira halophila DSM 15071]
MDRPLRTYSLAGLLALLLGASPAVAVAEPPLDLESVKETLQQGDLEAARERVESILAEQPDHPGARFVRARILAREGDEEGAIERLEALVADHPEMPEPYNNLAVLLARQGKLESARDALEKGLATSKVYSTLYENLSTVYVEMARRSYAHALQLDPEEEREEPGLRELAALEEPRRGRVSLMASVEDKDDADADAGSEAAEPADPQPAEDAADEEGAAAADEGGSARSENEALQVRADEAVTRAVTRRLHDWASAWSEQAVAEYVAAYAADYSPEGLNREEWEEQRRRRIQRPEWIQVELDRIEVWDTGPDTATAIVRQHYDADSYADVTLKSLQMVLEEGRWVISNEQTLKVLER